MRFPHKNNISKSSTHVFLKICPHFFVSAETKILIELDPGNDLYIIELEWFIISFAEVSFRQKLQLDKM